MICLILWPHCKPISLSVSSQCFIQLHPHLPDADIYLPAAVTHHLDQIPQSMTCLHFLIILHRHLSGSHLWGRSVEGKVALLSVPLLSARCWARWRGSHRFLSRFMWAPIPSPVAAGNSGGSLSELMGLMMFLQPLTRQTIANRNEPPATGARSAPVQWDPV